MPPKKAIIAILYDFDKTLCPKDMQEYSFIPNLDMQPAEFWDEANKLVTDKKMDTILSYMYLMIKKANERGIPIRREDFVKLGREITYFKGVKEWFKRIIAYGDEHSVKIEHYIISSGLKEVIEGTSISKEFKEIFACEFLYDVNGVAVWPKTAVNYTTKTQFLFRINKGVLDVSDNDSINRYTKEDDRPIPFRNMIYIGDGFTDVPCMKLVKDHGGQSIAVYNQDKTNVSNLLTDNRVNYIAPTDYTQGGELDSCVKTIISKMAVVDKLYRKHKKQLDDALV